MPRCTSATFRPLLPLLANAALEAFTLCAANAFTPVYRYLAGAIEVQQIVNGEGYVIGPIHDLGDQTAAKRRRPLSYPRENVLFCLGLPPFIRVVSRLSTPPGIFQESIERCTCQVQAFNRKII